MPGLLSMHSPMLSVSVTRIATSSKSIPDSHRGSTQHPHCLTQHPIPPRQNRPRGRIIGLVYQAYKVYNKHALPLQSCNAHNACDKFGRRPPKSVSLASTVAGTLRRPMSHLTIDAHRVLPWQAAFLHEIEELLYWNSLATSCHIKYNEQADFFNKF